MNEILNFEDGLTVKELKALIKDWPDERADGTPTEVWLSDASGYSNIAVEFSSLDLDEDGIGDLIIAHDS